ncbi:MAG: hypothetical protein ACPGLV_09985 [Bacteroidia bacterium]
MKKHHIPFFLFLICFFGCETKRDKTDAENPEPKENNLEIDASIESEAAVVEAETKVDTIKKYRRWLPGNRKLELISVEGRNNRFKDPVDVTIHHSHFADKIYTKDDSAFVLSTRTMPYRDLNEKNDRTRQYVAVEYFQDITYWFDTVSYFDIDGSFFSAKGKVLHWWYNSDGTYVVSAKGANPKTFVPFEGISGGKDDKHVFYDGLPSNFKIIEGCDPKTVRVLNPERGCGNCGNCYFVDKHSVFFGLNKIEADPYTFKLVNEEKVDAIDKNGKWFDGKLLQ